MRRVAFVNEKGGTCKTTLTVNIGAWLAREKGKKTLIVDMDTQGHCGKSLGVDVREAAYFSANSRPACSTSSASASASSTVARTGRCTAASSAHFSPVSTRKLPRSSCAIRLSFIDWLGVPR